MTSTQIQIDRKPKADNKKDKHKSQAAEKRNKDSTRTETAETASKMEKKSRAQVDEVSLSGNRNSFWSFTTCEGSRQT
jgi:hypothetical protein